MSAVESTHTPTARKGAMGTKHAISALAAPATWAGSGCPGKDFLRPPAQAPRPTISLRPKAGRERPLARAAGTRPLPSRPAHSRAWLPSRLDTCPWAGEKAPTEAALRPPGLAPAASSSLLHATSGDPRHGGAPSSSATSSGDPSASAAPQPGSGLFGLSSRLFTSVLSATAQATRGGVGAASGILQRCQ